MLIFVFVIILIGLLFWTFGFIKANDLSTSVSMIPQNITKVLIIFPHADDEALTTGGFISNLTSNGVKVTWVILTQGERGNEGAHLDEKLKEIRRKESEKVAKLLGVKTLIQKDFPDNGVVDRKEELEKYIAQLLGDINPNLVITYDRAGMYGHPDHIVVSEVVTKMVKVKGNIKLWYASYPRKILDSVALPEHMAKDKEYSNKRAYPTHRVWVGFSGVLKKIKAVHAYKSQQLSFQKMMPVKVLPLWFFVSLTPYEYYHEVM